MERKIYNFSRNSIMSISNLLRPNNYNLYAGGLDMGNAKITNIATPTDPTDAVNKAYVDTHSGVDNVFTNQIEANDGIMISNPDLNNKLAIITNDNPNVGEATHEMIFEGDNTVQAVVQVQDGDLEFLIGANKKMLIGSGSIDALVPLNVPANPTGEGNATNKGYVDGAIEAALNGVHPGGNLTLTGDLSCDDIIAGGNVQINDGLTVSNTDGSSKFIFSLYDANGATHKMDFYNNYSADGTNNKVVSSIQCSKGSNNNSGALLFYTSGSDPNGLTERMEIADNGTVSMSGSANIGASLNVDNGRLNVIDGGNVSINAILDMNNKAITNVLDPVNLQDASTKNYVDNAISNVNGIPDGILHLYSGAQDGECFMEFVNGDEQTGSRYGFIGVPSNNSTTFDIATASSIPTITFAPEGVNVLSLNDTSVMMNKPLNMNSQAITNVLDPVNLQDGATKNYVDTQISAIPAQSNTFTNLTVSNDATLNNISASGSVLVPTATLAGQAVNLGQLSSYATTTSLNDEVAGINSDLTTNYALKSELPDLSGYATTTALNAEVATINSDLTTNYALKSELPDVSGYITSSELTTELADYATTTQLSDYAIVHGSIDWAGVSSTTTADLNYFSTPANATQYILEVIFDDCTGNMTKGTDANLSIRNNTTSQTLHALPLEDYLTNSTSTTEYFDFTNSTLKFVCNAGDVIYITINISSGEVSFDATNSVSWNAYPLQ